MIDVNNILNMQEAAAKELILSKGYKVRIRSRDGRGMMGEARADNSRVNLHIDNGIVIKASIG